jgi:MFS family permease
MHIRHFIVSRIFTPTPEAPGPREDERRPFRYFLLLTALHGILGRLLGYFIPIYFRELGFSGVQIGLYFSISTVATLALSLPMGISTDRKSIRGIFVLSYLLISASYVGFIFTRSFLVFCLFAFLGSFGARFHGTARSSMFFKISNSADSHDAGLYQMTSFVATGLGMLLGAFIIAGASFRHAFVLACLGNLVLAGLSWFLPRTESVAIKLTEYRREVFTPRVLFLAFVFTLSSLHWGAEMVSYSPFLRETLGLSLRMTGVYTATGFIVLGAGAYLGVVLLRRGIVKDIRWILTIGFVLGGVFQILMCVRNPWLSYAMRMLHELGDGFVFLAFYHGISNIFHVNKIGGCAAFMSLCMSLGSMGSSVLFGYIGDRWGHQWPLILSGGLLVLLPLLLALNPNGMDGGNGFGTGGGQE